MMKQQLLVKEAQDDKAIRKNSICFVVTFVTNLHNQQANENNFNTFFFNPTENRLAICPSNKRRITEQSKQISPGGTSYASSYK